MRLEPDDRRELARWAADCAERVLARFEAERPGDDRPRKAIAAARDWASEECPVAAARAASLAAHAAARDADEGPAAFAARAAGHAAATAHVAGHAPQAAAYATKADPSPEEAAWQRKRLSPRLRRWAFPGEEEPDGAWPQGHGRTKR